MKPDKDVLAQTSRQLALKEKEVPANQIVTAEQLIEALRNHGLIESIPTKREPFAHLFVTDENEELEVGPFLIKFTTAQVIAELKKREYTLITVDVEGTDEPHLCYPRVRVNPLSHASREDAMRLIIRHLVNIRDIIPSPEENWWIISKEWLEDSIESQPYKLKHLIETFRKHSHPDNYKEKDDGSISIRY